MSSNLSLDTCSLLERDCSFDIRPLLPLCSLVLTCNRFILLAIDFGVKKKRFNVCAFTWDEDIFQDFLLAFFQFFVTPDFPIDPCKLFA